MTDLIDLVCFLAIAVAVMGLSARAARRDRRREPPQMIDHLGVRRER